MLCVGRDFYYLLGFVPFNKIDDKLMSLAVKRRAEHDARVFSALSRASSSTAEPQGGALKYGDVHDPLPIYMHIKVGRPGSFLFHS